MSNKTENLRDKFKAQVASFTPSSPMLDLLDDDRICNDLFVARDSIMSVMNQLQRDVITNTNASEVGLTVLGLKQFQDALELFATRGLLNKENNTK